MTSELVIPDVTVEDNGTYICKATIAGTLTMDATVSVTVHGAYEMDKV